MSYLIALGLGALCMGLVSLFVWIRPTPTIISQNPSQNREFQAKSSLLADAPPPEDQGTPGRRS